MGTEQVNSTVVNFVRQRVELAQQEMSDECRRKWEAWLLSEYDPDAQVRLVYNLITCGERYGENNET